MTDRNEDLKYSDAPEAPAAEPKKKRQLSEKQLANLAKAREKAQVTLKAKRERNNKLKAEEKKLKELRFKEREDKIAAEIKLMQSNQDQEEMDDEPPPKPKPKRKPKKQKVVYYTDSSSEEEVVYKRKPKVPKAPPVRKPPEFALPVDPQAEERPR